MPDVVGWWRRRRWERWRWLVLAAVVGAAAVGVWRVESTAARAQDAADEAKAATARLTELVAALEAERVERCVAGRGDTRSAIVRVVDEFTDLTPAEVAEVSEAVAEEIPTAACTTPP